MGAQTFTSRTWSSLSRRVRGHPDRGVRDRAVVGDSDADHEVCRSWCAHRTSLARCCASRPAGTSWQTFSLQVLKWSAAIASTRPTSCWGARKARCAPRAGRFCLVCADTNRMAHTRTAGGQSACHRWPAITSAQYRRTISSIRSSIRSCRCCDPTRRISTSDRLSSSTVRD